MTPAQRAEDAAVRRERIASFLDAHPLGVTIHEIKAHVCLADSTCEVHISVLREQGRVLWMQVGRQCLWTHPRHREALTAHVDRIRAELARGLKARRAEREKDRNRPNRQKPPSKAERQAVKDAQQQAKAATKQPTRYRWCSEREWQAPQPVYPSIWHYAERMAA